MQVYMAKFYKDRELKNAVELPGWLTPIQVGAALTDERVAALTDDSGDNISRKNPNYCELTALYWIWKNALDADDYYGLFHYRRWLDVKDEDIKGLEQRRIDAILPYPMLHEPDIREHHTRYISDNDWEAVLQALRELAPDYYAAYPCIFSQQYFYNYNILIARKQVFSDYCGWLFPILERVEALTGGEQRADRYMGYIGENLLTLYFMYHKDKMNLAHTGRIMLI